MLALTSIAWLSACQSTSISEELPRGGGAYDIVGPVGANPIPTFRIGPFDVLRIATFNEPELSFEEIPVDANGGFSFPFIGRVEAAGHTSQELEAELKRRLETRYLRDAQVSVFVTTSASQLFTVEGDVDKPGAYEYAGTTTLLGAMARAGSPTYTARLNEIVVFREVNNERYGAVFNLEDIREGRVPDPEIFAGDTIFVGYDAVKSAWREFLTLAPIINVFTRF